MKRVGVAVMTDSYSESSWFESRPEHHLFLMFLVVSLSPSRQKPGQYLDYTMTVSFQIPSSSPFISSYHLALYRVTADRV
jgi:hypothetical protein